MAADTKPRLAITMGDAAGIGPEVIVAAWTRPEVHATVRPLVVGHPEILRRAAKLLKSDAKVVELDADAVSRGQWAADDRTIACLKACNDDVLDVPAGAVDRRAGEAAYQCVCAATKLVQQGHLDGIVTAPLSKAALHASAHFYPGHTELLADLCNAKEFAMMLYLPAGPAVRGPAGLGVAHVTLHQSLRSVFRDLSTAAIIVKCRLADRVMRRLGVGEPRLAVAALNPHAGEQGLFGDEEQEIIAPAVDDARAAGLNVSGPFPTDTLMMRARDGEFDAVVAMYHDQGHIALKLLGMNAAVNITLGLPIVRTSVAHGTAFDRAWQGTANADGMVAAIRTAALLTHTQSQA
ncbi:MAG: 4-hydroxythreonine-4-phosphate dehydrogenase PdxA [Pirellulales bacterium]